jgi:hypothetical protein
MMDIVYTYWGLIDQNWFQWASLIGGFLLIYSAVRKVAHEESEKRLNYAAVTESERSVVTDQVMAAMREQLDPIVGASEVASARLNDSTRLPVLFAQRVHLQRKIEQLGKALQDPQQALQRYRIHLDRLRAGEGQQLARQEQAELENTLSTVVAGFRNALLITGDLPAFDEQFGRLTRPDMVINTRPDPSGQGVLGRMFEPEANRSFLVAHEQNVALLDDLFNAVNHGAGRLAKESAALEQQVTEEMRRLNE